MVVASSLFAVSQEKNDDDTASDGEEEEDLTDLVQGKIKL